MSIQNVTTVRVQKGDLITGHNNSFNKWVTLEAASGDRIAFHWDDINTLRAVLSKIAFEAAIVEDRLRQQTAALS